MLIKNRDSLLSRGSRDGRRVVLDILEAGLAAPDPYRNVKKIVRLENNKLSVGHPDLSDPPGIEPVEYDLNDVKNIYIIGGGKAAQRMAKSLEDILGDRISGGHINIKTGEPVQVERIGVTFASHPIPDENSVNGASRIMEIMEKAGEGDLVFWCQSGGATSLLALPAPGITLEDLQEVYRILYFGCGASMPESNAVRNLIAILNTKHEKYVFGASLFHLLTTERPLNLRAHLFDRPDHLNAYQQAIRVLKKYDCWNTVPESVRTFLNKTDSKYLPATPEQLKQRPYYKFRVMGPEYLIDAASAKAEEMGLNTAVLATSLNDVEARPTGEILADIAQEAEVIGRPLKPPCVFLCGGEVVVPIGEETGFGGRNQELVLAASQRIAGSSNIVIGSVDSDGTDGPTSVAGGIVDGQTVERINEAGFDLTEELKRHNTNPVLEAIGDTITTGNTGSNVRDLRVVYIGKDQS
ncbi:glycerate kinase [Chloroflexota bacterium]